MDPLAVKTESGQGNCDVWIDNHEIEEPNSVSENWVNFCMHEEVNVRMNLHGWIRMIATEREAS